MRMPTHEPRSAFAFGIASALTDVKRNRGLTGQQLAQASGFSQPQMSKWLNAKSDMLAKDLLQLCRGLGLDVREFLNVAEMLAEQYDRETAGESGVVTDRGTPVGERALHSPELPPSPGDGRR